MSDLIRIDVDPTTVPPVTPPPNPDAPQRPEWVPEKFWKDGKVDSEGMAKSYTELEQKLSAPPKKDDAPPAKPDEKPDDKGEKKEKPPQDNPTFDPYFDEFAKEGKLSEDSYTKLAAQGLSKDKVDAFIRGQQLVAEQEANAVYETVGGKEVYDKVAQWAAESLPPADVEAFNKVLEASDAGAVKLAVAGLHAKYTDANGSPGKRVRGTGNGQAVVPFASMDEVTAAMNDPRYKISPTYRAEVEQRIAQSTAF